MTRSLLLIFSLGVFVSGIARAEEFIVSDEFQVTSAVKPGLVKHPVMAALDNRGRLFVAENAGLNLNKEELLAQKPNSIRLLIDTDKDGVFDKATTFADGLTFPQGALWIYDSLYVMSPPSLWRFADRDGDGVAEEREELATGFDFTGNAADVHGPFLHPNGRLFWCHGRKGYAIPDHDNGEIMQRGKGARIWSSQLSGGEVEAFAGGGMDNPVEIDFTDEGEIIGTVNLFYGRPRGDTLTHWVHGGVYPRYDQEQAIEDLPRTGDLLPEVHDFGHVAVSGMFRYRSGKLNPDWTDQWIVSHFNTSRLTRTRLVREGSGFVAAETEEILKITKPDSHLTDVLEDHNGDLLAIDTGGWFRIGCPTSHIAKPEVAGEIYRISPADTAYRAPAYPVWENMTSEAVSGFLDAEEPWVRDLAGLELAGRGDPAIPELKRILRTPSSSPVARMNAVWTLTKLRFSESTDLILDALKDPDAGVRQAAANAISATRTWQSIAANEPAEREIELERNRTLSGALASIVRGDEPRVARQAAVALGRMAENRAVGAILGRLGRVENDRMLEHSLIYALIEIDDPEATRAGLDSENPKVISGVLRALHEMPSGELEIFSVLPHLDSEDPSLRKTAADLAVGTPEWDAAIANRFFEWDEINEARRLTMESVIAAFANHPPIRDFLTSLVTSEEADRKELGLSLMAGAPDLEIVSEWEPALAPFLTLEAPPELRELSLKILAADPGERFGAELNALVAEESLPRLTRLRATQATASQEALLHDTSFQLLLEILKEARDTKTRAEAIAILVSARLTAAQRIEVAQLADHFTPVEVPALMQLFRALRSGEEAGALAGALVNSPAFASYDMERLEQLFRPFPNAFSDELQAEMQAVRDEASQRAGKIDALIRNLETADAEAGKVVFESGKGSCLVCHRIEQRGGEVGPNLSTIGRIRSPRDLFESILYPNESIARDFNTYEVKQHGGKPGLIGLIESRTSSTVTLVDAAGQRTRLPESTIESITEIPMSLMPPGLEHALTPKELQDLVAYLLELK